MEDESRLAQLLVRVLSRCDFDVEHVPDGEAALDSIGREAYDLVLLDLLLPGVDGFAVLRRTLELRADQEVLVVSALGDVESKVRCLDLGASDYITKPVALAELVARMRARLRHAGASPEASRFLESGLLSLDLERHVAVRDGRPVPLSTREFLLLQYLMRQDGGVCTREQLLTEVWGYGFDPGTNVVDVYIRRLRTKLGSEIIETVRNVGYGFMSPRSTVR